MPPTFTDANQVLGRPFMGHLFHALKSVLLTKVEQNLPLATLHKHHPIGYSAMNENNCFCEPSSIDPDSPCPAPWTCPSFPRATYPDEIDFRPCFHQNQCGCNTHQFALEKFYYNFLAWHALEPRRTPVDPAESRILDPVLQLYASDPSRIEYYRKVICRLVEELKDPTSNYPHESFYQWSFWVHGSIGWRDISLVECLEQLKPALLALIQAYPGPKE